MGLNMSSMFKRLSPDQVGIESEIKRRLDKLDSHMIVPIRATNTQPQPYDITLLYAMVSSPRLLDVYLKGFDRHGFVEVGDTFLATHTELAYPAHPIVAVSTATWDRIKNVSLKIDECRSHDADITVVQVWPFDPTALSEAQLKIAVALSYSIYELDDDPRLAGAVNKLVACLGFAYNF